MPFPYIIESPTLRHRSALRGSVAHDRDNAAPRLTQFESSSSCGNRGPYAHCQERLDVHRARRDAVPRPPRKHSRPPGAPAAKAHATALSRDSRTAINRLLAQSPAAKALNERATAVLVFPNIRKAGFVVGGQYGEGTLFKGGKPAAYYSTAGVSYGLQAGAQKYGYAMFFMNDAALKHLDKADGFEIGVGPSVVVMDEGMAKTATTTTMNDDIYAFIFGQKGLMAGIGLQGNKITRIAAKYLTGDSMTPVSPVLSSGRRRSALAVFVAGSVGAAEIGQIKVSNGPVTVERKGESRPGSVGMRLESSDVVSTGAAGSVGITMADNSLLSAGPNSILSLDRFDFDPTSNQGRFDAQLQKGSLAVISGRIAKQSPEAMTVRTPSAILGVRGTEFVVAAND